MLNESFSLKTYSTDHNSCNVDLWLRIIQTVEHPRLKLYLITALLTKIDHKTVTLNPTNIYNSLCQLEAQFDDNYDKVNNNNNNNISISNNIAKKKHSISNLSAPTMKYPCLEKVNRRTASELTYEHHIELLLIALKSYTSIFHIEEFQQYSKNYDHIEEERRKMLERYRAEIACYQKETPEPFDLKQMEKLQQKPLDGRVIELGKNNPIYDLNVMNEDVNMLYRIHIDATKYRTDAKFIDLISTSLSKLKSKFSSLFPNFN